MPNTFTLPVHKPADYLGNTSGTVTIHCDGTGSVSLSQQAHDVDGALVASTSVDLDTAESNAILAAVQAVRDRLAKDAGVKNTRPVVEPPVVG